MGKNTTLLKISVRLCVILHQSCIDTCHNAMWIDLESILAFFALHLCIWLQKKKKMAENVLFLLVINLTQCIAMSSVNIVNGPVGVLTSIVALTCSWPSLSMSLGRER